MVAMSANPVLPSYLKQKRVKKEEKISRNLLLQDSDLLHVPDFRYLSYLEISLYLSSGYFIVFVVDCLSIIETVGGTDHHAGGDDRSSTDLLIILVDSYVPWHLLHVRAFA